MEATATQGHGVCAERTIADQLEGTNYQLELQLCCDDQPGGSIRLLGSTDDGGIRAIMPLTRDRIVSQSE